ncbi:hypothetical protein AO501_12380 [Mycobacterium gordonae]|uniref:Uncharacterized protein n=1 Tax=Mycobacterium gordonae TaxID=1778 RepID=A0A0Q2M7I7_MYCGO|nr:MULTISPECIES: hypothetical protein [Mycobacterium]KQH75839.1 hypothetical protein AO501_12380 [Mycobacterium gordonae]MDP7732572.1 hypothetical protein [Mycobacterium sp. TY813]
MIDWEEVNVPRGAYISWGQEIGQHVTGRVLEYGIDTGKDFNGKVCPSIMIELIEPADSIGSKGRSRHDAGEVVQLDVAQESLKRALHAADPAPGDLVKITLENLVSRPNGVGKEFGIKIARQAAQIEVVHLDDDDEQSSF